MAGTITHTWEGTTLVVTSDSGTSSCDLKGDKGDMGVRGAQGAAGLTVGNTIIGSGAPNANTGGDVGALYYDTVGEKLYFCTEQGYWGKVTLSLPPKPATVINEKYTGGRWTIFDGDLRDSENGVYGYAQHTDETPLKLFTGHYYFDEFGEESKNINYIIKDRNGNIVESNNVYDKYWNSLDDEHGFYLNDGYTIIMDCKPLTAYMMADLERGEALANNFLPITVYNNDDLEPYQCNGSTPVAIPMGEYFVNNSDGDLKYYILRADGSKSEEFVSYDNFTIGIHETVVFFTDY